MSTPAECMMADWNVPFFLSDYFSGLCDVEMGTRRCNTWGSPIGRLVLSTVGGEGVEILLTGLKVRKTVSLLK